MKVAYRNNPVCMSDPEPNSANSLDINHSALPAAQVNPIESVKFRTRIKAGSGARILPPNDGITSDPYNGKV